MAEPLLTPVGYRQIFLLWTAARIIAMTFNHHLDYMTGKENYNDLYTVGFQSMNFLASRGRLCNRNVVHWPTGLSIKREVILSLRPTSR